MKTTVKIQYKEGTLIPIRKLLFTLEQLEAGFYQLHGFKCVDEYDSLKKQQKFYVPQKVQEFIRENHSVIDKLQKGHFSPSKQSWALQNVCKEWFKSDFQRYFMPKPSFQLNKKEFIQLFQGLFQLFGIKRIVLTIFWVTMGTSGSWQSTKINNGTLKAVLMLRDNISTYGAYSTILTALVAAQLSRYSYETMVQIRDFLTKTVLRNIQKPFKKRWTVSDEEKSMAAYANMGFPINSPLSVANQRLLLYNRDITEDFSDSECKLLRVLVVNKNRTHTYDALGTVLWSNGTYSLEAIAKHIQRIRRKLLRLGIKQNVIIMKRKQGYTYVG